MKKKIEWKNFYWKKNFSEKNLLGKQFLSEKIWKEKIFWEKILLEKYLSEKNKTCWENNFCKKKIIGKKIYRKIFLSESGGRDECDLICIFVTKWADYVEEPMKYHTLRPHFFSMGGWCAGKEWVSGGVGGGGEGVVGMVVFVD